MLAAPDEPESCVRLLAVHHLLRVCEEHDAAGGDFERLLSRVRRVGSLDQRTSYRQVSDVLIDVEAIRLCTMHASRGLDLQAIHVPGLAEGHMPSPWRGGDADDRRGSSGGGGAAGHVGRERDLLAAVMSRAQERLHLSWAGRYARRALRPSRFLAALAIEPPHPTAAKPRLAPTPTKVAVGGRATRGWRGPITEQGLVAYLGCPARFRLEVLEGLPRPSGPASPHGGLVTSATADEAPDRRPNLAGPMSVGNVAPGHRPRHFPAVRDAVADAAVPLALDIDGVTVALRPDRVVSENGMVRVQRLVAGMPPARATSKVEDALRGLAAAQRFPGARVIVETLDEATGTVRVSSPAGEDRVRARCGLAVAGIVAGAFDPSATIASRGCAPCPWYLACEH